MRQYVKNKPIKWGFKFWYHDTSKTGYLFQFDLYLGKKEKREEILESSVVLALIECLEDTYCTIFFDNFFNSPSLNIKLFEKGVKDHFVIPVAHCNKVVPLCNNTTLPTL